MMNRTQLSSEVDEESLRQGRVVVRFAGDSGDGIQLFGRQFAQATAQNENDLITFSDFPAEIRAPVGTTYGVSAFQIQFGGPVILTIGDQIDILVAFNPAALKTNIDSLRSGGLIIVDADSFNQRNLLKAGYEDNPLSSALSDNFQIIEIELGRLTREAVADKGVTKKQADQTKNFWALGLIYWMFDRDRTATQAWIQNKFSGDVNIANANIAALNAGHTYGEIIELGNYQVPESKKAEFCQGDYRSATGTDVLVFGLVAGALASGCNLNFCSYPITPASGILHGLSKLSFDSIQTFQAEDEIAAVTAAIGASYAGSIGVTASSGPGIALKAEAIGLAVAAELPLVVINVQRAGPSTGMPTKTEQADLNLALYGRHGEAPLIVLAPATPSECFELTILAVRLAIKYMTPVILLCDGYITNAAEPWRIPDLKTLPAIQIPTPKSDGEPFKPFVRDETTLARPWAVPGMPGLEHRIGGIERADGSGNISYDPDNHQKMSDFRAQKIANAAKDIPDILVERGQDHGSLAIIGWGSTYGPANAAANELIKQGYSASHIQIRYLSPLPNGLEALLSRFDKVLVVEMNNGQLCRLLRAEFLIPALGLNQVNGRPFKVSAIKQAAFKLLENSL